MVLNGIATGGFKFDGDGIVGFSIYKLEEVVRGTDAVEAVVWRSTFSEHDTQRWERVDQEEINRRDAEMQATIHHTAAVAGGLSHGALSALKTACRIPFVSAEFKPHHENWCSRCEDQALERPYVPPSAPNRVNLSMSQSW